VQGRETTLPSGKDAKAAVLGIIMNINKFGRTSFVTHMVGLKERIQKMTEQCKNCVFYACEDSDLGLGYCDFRPKSRYATYVSGETVCKYPEHFKEKSND